jgi:hypothetical protein
MGYSQAELDAIQARWSLRFPPDLVALLRERRPLLDQPKAFDWLKADDATIQKMLDWPFESFWFDVEQADAWPEWGDRPERLADQHARLKEIFVGAPRLIPLFGHRYLPEEPGETGNPVFSVYQMDVVCYGTDLVDWIARETHGWDCRPWPPIKEIRFWSDALRHNNAEPVATLH